MNIKCSMFPEDSNDFPWDKSSLDNFKKLINENKIKCQMDDIFLLGFLRARKFDQQRSLQLLKNYYSIRKYYPNYFKNLLPSKLEHVLSLKAMQVLPKPDQKGRYLFVVQMGNWDTSIANSTDFFRTVMLFLDFQLNFHRTQQNRVVIIVNAEGISVRHFLQFSPRLLNSMISVIFRDSYQMRFEEIHYVNVNVILKALLSMFIPLLSQKLKKRLYLHTEMKTLHEFIHPQYLPAEYEGELPNFDPTEANEMIRENEEFFKINEEYVNLYKEMKSSEFNEGTFRYIGEDDQFKQVLEQSDDQFEQTLKQSEIKFNRVSEDPEKFFSLFEQDSELEITHL